MSKTSFDEAKNLNFKTLQQYVPIVERVHGGNHPEFHEVRELFDAINAKAKKAGSNLPELNEEFAKLRAITDNYTIPKDACEAFTAVYNMLAAVDKAYHD